MSQPEATFAETPLTRNRGPVHEPEVDLPAAAVAPQDVGFTIAVEIAHARITHPEATMPRLCWLAIVTPFMSQR